MKLAFFSPLNPIQSGISDYSEELLGALKPATVRGRPLDIDLYIDRGYRPSSSSIAAGFDVLPATRFQARAAEYDAAIYQMGNSPAHAYIYRTLLRHPGVVVMHEFILHHLRIWMALNGGRRREYMSLMEERYGEEGREAARRVLLGQFPEALFKYPLSDEAIGAANGVIVHSRYMEGLVREVRPDVPVGVVPMGVPLPPLIPKEEARARLGLPPDLFLVTSVGHLNPYKRVSATLRAFKALLMEVPNALYLLVGSRSPNYDPTRQIEMLELGERVRTTGYVPAEHLPFYLAASDVSLNLRYPTAGETSAALLRIMGAGVPVLVSRTGSFEELPEEAAGKVDVGEMEEELLLEYLLLLARRPEVREAMSAAARRYVAEQHTLEGAAEGYLRFIAALDEKREGAQVDVPVASDPRPATHDRRPYIAVEQPIMGGVSTQAPVDLLPDDHPLSILSRAAAGLGISERDEPVLAALAGAVGPLLREGGARS